MGDVVFTDEVTFESFIHVMFSNNRRPRLATGDRMKAPLAEMKMYRFPAFELR